jgi:hypothetical protein
VQRGRWGLTDLGRQNWQVIVHGVNVAQELPKALEVVLDLQTLFDGLLRFLQVVGRPA